MAGVIKFDRVSKGYRVVRQRPLLMRDWLHRIIGRRADVQRHWALTDVSFEIQRGESVGIIGGNGSGKSTTLALIAGTSYATSGVVRSTGRIGPLLELGAGFHPDLTGYENIYLNASLLGLSRAELESRLESIIEYSGLGDFVHAPIRTYSTGMTARLGFSILAHLEPDILLVDEALAVGDQEFRGRCLETMRRFREEGITLVIVSHDLPMVRSLCQRVIWLDKGSVRADGLAADVLDLYHGQR